MSSYEKINYSLRPAKAIERKMLCDAMRRLSFFHRIEDYQYIGFGSTFFTDFAVFHKSLGINKMLSIEKEKKDAERFFFNLPFSCVDLEMGHSAEILPAIDWARPSIVWLDYDDRLESFMLNDLRTFFDNAKEGSMILISFNAHQTSFEGLSSKELFSARFQELVKRLEGYEIPSTIGGKDLNMKNYPSTYYKILDAYTKKFMRESNIKKGTESKLKFEQIFNFVYQDGVQMYTYGGIVLSKKQTSKFKNAKFNDLEYVRTNEDIFKIEVPSLTLKEINFLNSLLPTKINASGKFIENETNAINGIPSDAISQYYKIYRYFPTFTESIL